MSRFIKLAIKLAPFMTCDSEGDPDPKKRSASVVLKFHGSDAIKHAQELHRAIVADVRAACERNN